MAPVLAKEVAKGAIVVAGEVGKVASEVGATVVAPVLDKTSAEVRSQLSSGERGRQVLGALDATSQTAAELARAADATLTPQLTKLLQASQSVSRSAAPASAPQAVVGPAPVAPRTDPTPTAALTAALGRGDATALSALSTGQASANALSAEAFAAAPSTVADLVDESGAELTALLARYAPEVRLALQKASDAPSPAASALLAMLSTPTEASLPSYSIGSLALRAGLPLKVLSPSLPGRAEQLMALAIRLDATSDGSKLLGGLAEAAIEGGAVACRTFTATSAAP